MTNQIQTILGYQTKDGKQFHDLAEAQTHTKRSLFAAIHKEAMSKNPAFHALPAELIVDFLMAYGRNIAVVATDDFKPIPPKLAEGGRVNVKVDGDATRKVLSHPALAAPYGSEQKSDPLKAAMRGVDLLEEGQKLRDAEARKSGDERFGAHPLSAPAAQ